MRHVQFLVEGYDDRAFVAGWLHRRGFDVAIRASGVFAESARRLGRAKGSFTFVREGRVLASVTPYQPQTHAPSAQRALARERLSDAVADVEDGLEVAIVVGWDPDTEGNAPRPDPRQHLANLFRGLEVDGATVVVREVGPGVVVAVGGHRVPVLPLVYACDDDDPRLPSQQTLERTVLAAMRETAVAHRVDQARAFLDGRTAPAGKDPKAHAGAVWAGWHADGGWGDFYKALWRIDGMERALLARVEPDGVVEAIESLLDRAS